MDISGIVSFVVGYVDPLYLLYGFVAWLVISIVALDVTMTQFLAVMRIREMRDSGAISPTKTPVLYWYCMLVLIRGILCDVWVQMNVCTVVGLELPIIGIVRWKGIPLPKIEWLTTSRLIRWNKEPVKGWWTINVKKRFVEFGKLMLDPADTDGKHI